MRICSAIVGLLLLGLWMAPAGASPQEDLEKAAKQKKVVFLLVTQTQPPAIGVEALREMVQQVASQTKNCTIVEMDRSDPINADFVAKERLTGAPVPLVLLVGRNGLVTAGIVAAQATPERLLTLVPSPKKEEVLQALKDQKIVFVEVTRKDMDARDAAHAACSAACGQLVGKCVAIAIDMDDPAEQSFLTQLGVDPIMIEPVTLVVNAAGQITGNYKGVTTADELLVASQKRAGGCAPGACGAGKSCGPAK